MFQIPKYTAPDFSREIFVNAPNVRTGLVTIKGVAPDHYHATSMYPEYYKIKGEWILLPQTRMDCVPVIHDDGSLEAKEFRRLSVGETVIIGRTDDGSEGIYLYSNGFKTEENKIDTFAFRSGRSRVLISALEKRWNISLNRVMLTRFSGEMLLPPTILRGPCSELRWGRISAPGRISITGITTILMPSI